MAGFENYKNVIINVSEWLYWTTDIILYEFKYNSILLQMLKCIF